MNGNDIAAQWGLPPGFQPVRYPVPDDVKSLIRDLLNANEPVIVSITNEDATISLIGTPQRLFSVRTGATAGVTGFNVREFPWEGITNLVLQSGSLNVKIAMHYRTTGDGRTVEVGRRAAMGRPAVDNLMPFETAAGTAVFQAIHSIWHHKRASA
jgi:hypothetical protein